MNQTTSRSGLPFMMARDIAKNVSKDISSEAKDRDKNEKTVAAGGVKKMIAIAKHSLRNISLQIMTLQQNCKTQS